MTYPEFEARWKKSGGAERANYGLFLVNLCSLLGVPPPNGTTDNPAQDTYVLERAVTFNDGGVKKSTGRIDLYKRGCFVLETKQGTDSPDTAKQAELAQLDLPAEKRRKGHAVRGTAKWGLMMEAARQQAIGYVKALPPEEPRPLFVVVVDVGYSIDLYSNFAGVGDSFQPFPDQQRFRLPLTALANEDTRAMLQLLFTDPRELDPSRRAAQVTRKLAAQLAALSAQLEQAGHASEVVAAFLMRCLFTMFAEDVALIPKESFSGLLKQYDTDALRPRLADALTNLWATMDTGGFTLSLAADIPKFNGQLFHGATALPLSVPQLTLLREAAAANWANVEPAIFGTLLERALNPKERHRLGAHYTPRRYVERLVLPTVMDPLRREWAAAQAASAQRQNAGNDKDARAELVKFQRRLTSLRILDPACGSGNFLYVTLEHLKRLEGEVLAAINAFGHTGLLDLAGTTTVGPRQLLGLELNPRAAAIADVVLRIGYLQWHIRTHGLTHMPSPLLTDDHNIRQQDAALHHGPPVPRLDALGQPVTRWDGTYRPNPATGQPMPDETARVAVLDYPNPEPAEWPAADFIVGNPPFIGASRLLDVLGEGYAEALRKAYKGQVPDSADFVMYWWHNAAQAVQAGATERFGFITTNSLKQTFNRRVLQPFLEGDKPPLALTFAIPDHPWIDSGEGAAVRIAITVAEPAGPAPGRLLTVQTETVPEGDDAADVVFLEQQGRILPDLSIGADLDTSRPLKANAGLSNRGFELGGAGFIVSPETARSLGLGEVIGLDMHIRPYRNGRDLTDKPRKVLVIDLFGLSDNEALERFPSVYQHVLQTVKPERDQNRDRILRENWWLHRRLREDLRQSLNGLSRYIATVETAKHRLFQFLDANIIPDNKLIVFALDDAYHLGVLSSHIHHIWAVGTGSTLESRPVYVKTKGFEPFPFPNATPVQQARIRKLAETIDTCRKRQQAEYPSLTLTKLYNVVEQLRAGQLLTPEEQTINQQGFASVLLDLHKSLDAAVAEAYGWPVSLSEPEVLTLLVQLNQIRGTEEANGLVRHLRPAYQDQGQQQAAMKLATAAIAEAATPASAQAWPAELVRQMQAVREVVAQATVPLTSKQVAAQFIKTRPAQVQPMLDTLAGLSLLRWVETENAYAA
ncbi:class I SAM-dependent DNA methyltransferase [Hymenobacter sp. BT770]|uniref:class I SAM-dependent DNA methyltransferase n=1 Tax=Hymenobacter sp. BT770 TaxID=2886942 RepID=UPI001D0F55A9|nr:DNA methyltransferase [Hymenobacter sp. BT770]MCC3152762.1 class I SAM-dependent DNA methyltransferase [Hymenobacter sp. BT770]MDO3414837.1 class I SAM-dependent DNA methyltransferase [Hymenobacter sp. BT770]